ncbi:MAG: guanine deaminase [Alphaproteobacteria bacterium]|nr:guanine deaminase [Alphaproteobacteria bacterium]
MRTRILRGRLLWFVDDPFTMGDAPSHRYAPDGALLVADGRIAAAGEAQDVLAQAPAGTHVDDHRPHLILPGFIDTHIHFPQTHVIASYGEQLLDWLNRYTFVEEQKYADPAHAARQAQFFCDELLRQGTTTAVVYSSVHAAATEALFVAAAGRGMRIAAGKVMMDRNAPEALRDTPEEGYRESKALIARWHGRGRAQYVISPRFAITSTEAQLEAAGTLLREHPDCLAQTHMSENLGEIAAVRSLFPGMADYSSVYERFGLLSPRTLLGHCIHLAPEEWDRLAAQGAVAVHCPTSNLFIGSGLFDFAAALDRARPVRLSLATDVGGGTSYSMLRTAAEAYKVAQLRGFNLSPFAALHLMTRGNALAMGLDGVIGSFAPGAEADAVVLDSHAIPALAHRMETVRDLAEELFALITLGDERCVRATYVMGELANPP